MTYDPNGAFESLAVGETATDTFSYTITDGQGGFDTATVTVTIHGQNDIPDAVDDVDDADEDGPAITIDVLANDSDADLSDVLSVDSLNTAHARQRHQQRHRRDLRPERRVRVAGRRRDRHRHLQLHHHRRPGWLSTPPP